MNTSSPLAPRPLHPKKWSRLPRFAMSGNDGRRELYANAKNMLSMRAVSARRRIAEEADAGELQIPNEQGFALYPPQTFPETEELVQWANNRVAELKPETLQTRKAQLKQGFLDMSTLHRDSLHTKFALRPDVLGAIARYLGVAPILADIDVWYSTHADSQKYSNSQLWHCDTIDTTQVKIFLYSNEVTIDSGPLVVMGADASKKLRDSLSYVYSGDRVRVSDEEANAVVQPKDQHPIVGPSGTWAFVDSSRCFHYGSRVNDAAPPRIVTVFQYFTPSAFVFPIDYRKIAPLKHLATPEMLPIQRMALGAE